MVFFVDLSATLEKCGFKVDKNARLTHGKIMTLQELEYCKCRFPVAFAINFEDEDKIKSVNYNLQRITADPSVNMDGRQLNREVHNKLKKCCKEFKDKPLLRARKPSPKFDKLLS